MTDDNSRTPLLNDTNGLGASSFSEISEDELNSNYQTQPISPRPRPLSDSRSVQGQQNDVHVRGDGHVDHVPLPAFVYALTSLSAIGGFLFGYDTGVISGAMLLLKDSFHLNAVWQELVVSVTIAAAALFAIVGGYTNDCVGRKPTILMASFVFTLGSAVLSAAANTIMLLCGRIIVGIGIGLASMTVPMYIAESAPPHMRGRLVTLNNIFITGGQFVASIVAGLFSSNKMHGWRYMLGLAGLPSLVQLVGFLFMPESPRWLLQKGRSDEARATLQRIRGRRDVEMELSEVRESCEQAARAKAESGSSTITRMLKTPHVRKALFVGCGLQMFQQICGINTVMYYSATIIKMSGVSNGSMAIWLASATAATNFVFTFLGLYLVDRIGRKSLALGSLAGTLLSLALLAVSFQLASVRSPPITVHNVTGNASVCDQYSSCNPCMQDSSCGFCYDDMPAGGATNGSCAPVGRDDSGAPDPDLAGAGRCGPGEHPGQSPAVWAYDYCPTGVSWLAVVGLVCYLACFAPGMGPMPWTINSEIYPLWARSTGVSVATTTNWVFNLLISMTFLSLTQALTRYGVFWLYSGFAFLGIIFLLLYLPETKGRTLEQVEQLFKKPWMLKRPRSQSPTT